MEPSCDRINVGLPNCGDGAMCAGEYTAVGSTRTLKATSAACAYVTFKTGLSLTDVLQLDADVFIAPGTCKPYDNLGFWFFQTAELGAPLQEPNSHWDAMSEVDLMETYIGPGAVNSINTNFAATGLAKQWTGFTIEGGVRQHVTMWQDVEGTNCPKTRASGILIGTESVDYGKELPVVAIYVAHCAPGSPCCEGEGCKALQGLPDTAFGCITVKEAPILLALSNWGAGHRITEGCEIGASDVTVRTK
uniref:Uncharacterized protein n=1 Tax=Zooxanthella nutricula TaxID=1333877 RepID=A0A7S2LVX2_9DINO|mmetsp:Transcript_66661/g.203915  ORF Transcript_66661/g.203915 Transcript_66661/m.203915 type:complete len:248 (+) Transcript_66661:236-979(+)